MYLYKKILLIEDDVDDQFFFKDALRELEAELFCIIVDNGAEALKTVKIPPPPDIIFLDLNMPVMNGMECLQVLKKQHGYVHIPVVIFTTSSNADDKQKCFQLGAVRFITKPTSFQAMKDVLKQALSTAY